jgi:hypothetical protein
MPLPEEDDKLVIKLETSDDNETIILTFESEARKISLGLDLQEAQLLSLMLGEKVAAALLANMDIFPTPSEKIH